MTLKKTGALWASWPAGRAGPGPMAAGWRPMCVLLNVFWGPVVKKGAGAGGLALLFPLGTPKNVGQNTHWPASCPAPDPSPQDDKKKPEWAKMDQNPG